MKFLGSAMLLFALGVTGTGIAYAQVSTTSPHQIGFFCPPYTDSFAEGGFYQFPTTTFSCVFRIGDLPSGNTHYGGLFKGIIGNSTGAGNSMSISSERTLNLSGPLGNPAQDDQYFAAIWELRPGTPGQFDLQNFLNFFRTGANPPPHNNWGAINWKWGQVPSDNPDPVIIIPGILGSQEHNGVWEIDPILHTYDDLIATLDINHYTPGFDLFTLPYDWRKSNVDTAILLKQKIDEVKTICACNKVDLVAHSMGGLVARQYIQSDAYEDDVDQLIFLGTPHLGAPKAYLMWEGGELAPFSDLFQRFMEIFLLDEARKNGYETLFEYMREKPIDSVRELLPIYDYLSDAGTLRSYPQSYPTNPFLESLNNSVGNLTSSGAILYNFIGETPQAQTINGIRVLNINQYFPMWEHGYPESFYSSSGDHGLELGSGDGTVPLSSASFVNSNLITSQSDHNGIPEDSQSEIFQILTGNEASILIDNINLLNLKFILIKMLSPADLFVLAPDGKKIGKDLTTGLEVNEIPNAFYTGFTTETEFITILNPIDGEYKIYTQGTGSGAYTVETNYIDNATTTETSYTGNTDLGLITELKLEIDTQNPEDIKIIPPDTTPPVITIASPESKDYLRSQQLQVNVSAQDDSGVATLETKLGTSTVPNIGIVDLFFMKLGEYKLTASSTDTVGNATTSSITFRVIATPDSTLSDFERAKTLGWMNALTYLILKTQFKTYLNLAKSMPNVFKKSLGPVMLTELQRYRGKGLNEQGYQLLREDIEWLIKN